MSLQKCDAALKNSLFYNQLLKIIRKDNRKQFL